MNGQEIGQYVADIYNTIRQLCPAATSEDVRDMTIAAIDAERLG
jgi:hypothetical protein